MRVLLQRVSRARVTVDGNVTGEVGNGLLLLVGIRDGDSEAEIDWMARKVAQLRVFSDTHGKMNLSVQDVHGGVLAISQFTLYGDTAKGNRPSYISAARPEVAEPLYEKFCEQLSALIGKPVAKGVFGARMDVELVNDGPVTLMLEKSPG
ncbi:MAG: D-tyrosyl-tRNA(Tyr) deacylase [Planctomycetes bacterium]|nr:D-tyrosyl-tRNA(Tyr) deacylase [Planctomycetota bacterium]